MRIDSFIKNNIIMLVASSLGSFFNLLYQLVMLRLVSGGVFASLNSLLSFLVIISVPAGAFTTMVTKHISASSARKETEKLRVIWQRLAMHSCAFSLFVFFAIVLFSRNIADFLRLDSANSIMILAGIFFVTGLIPVVNGGLQGLEKFGWLAAVSIASGILKLLLSFGLVRKFPQLESALLGFFFPALAGLLISIFPISFLIKGRTNYKVDLKKLYLYILPISAVSVCFAMLTNIDMILVKHFFLIESQSYAVAQMIGKIVLFIPGAVYIIMFSRVSGLHAAKEGSAGILKRSVFLTFILSFSAVAFYNLFPQFVMKFLSGSRNPETIALARIFSLAMFFYAMSNVLFYYQLSIESYGFIKYLILMTILQALCMSLFHGTTFLIAAITLLASLFIFVFNLYSTFMQSRPKSILQGSWGVLTE